MKNKFQAYGGGRPHDPTTNFQVHLPNYSLPSEVRPMCGAKNAYSYSSADNGFGTDAGYNCEDCKYLVKEYREQFK